VQAGVIAIVSEAATHAAEGRTGLAAMLLLWASVVLPAMVDNIPYVAAMSPVAAGLAGQAGPGGNVLGRARAPGAGAATPPPSAPRPASSP
jgi:Na+/H+ antiporter NhaD/arsenite permease-like protein